MQGLFTGICVEYVIGIINSRGFSKKRENVLYIGVKQLNAISDYLSV